MIPDKETLEKLKRYPRKLRVAWALIFISAISAFVNLTNGNYTFFQFTGMLVTNPPAKFLPFYLGQIVGLNVLTLIGMAVAIFEWKRNKNVDGKMVFKLSMLVFFGIALTH